MFTLVAYSPVIAALLIIAYMFLPRRGKDTNIWVMIIVEFGVGVAASVLYAELFLDLMTAVDLPADMFTQFTRDIWKPSALAFALSIVIVGLNRINKASVRRRTIAQYSDYDQ